AILTDIEGTTSSIAFVKEVLFPYARRALPGFVALHGGEPEVRRWLGAVAEETGDAGDDALIATLHVYDDAAAKLAPGTQPATRCTATHPARWRRNSSSLSTAPPAI
ncbi:MAG: hypothetical protein LC647_18385, partial [Beggiatoa sp.]|nr:hypothetical protein [Beggiatoa sp.]